MLENIVELAPEQTRELCLKWMAYMENDVDFWPYGGIVHQKRHWSRVLVLAMKIGVHEGLSEADLEALAMAAAFHDTRRFDAWPDSGHGDRGAEHYALYCQEQKLPYDPRCYLAISWHDRDDELGLQAVQEWDSHHQLQDGWNCGATLIYQIFKDSDGLDRLRLNEKALSMKFIRVPYARTLKPFAMSLLLASQEVGTWNEAALERPAQIAASPEEQSKDHGWVSSKGVPSAHGWDADTPVVETAGFANPNPLQKKYLVVVDVQNDFVTGSLGTKEAQEALPRMVDKVRNFDGTVVYTMDTHTVNYLNSQEGSKLPVEHCIVNTWGWQLVDELAELQSQNGNATYLKGTFGSIDLAHDIEQAYYRGNIESVEIIGLCTDICVVSNALLIKAQLPNIQIIVDSSCCAGVTPELHEAALNTMKSCLIDVR